MDNFGDFCDSVTRISCAQKKNNILGVKIFDRNKFKSEKFFKVVYQKYSDMLNMKALVGIRIVFMGKEFE